MSSGVQYHHRPMSSSHGPTHQAFKSSPFYHDMQTLTPPRLCMEAKERTLSVALTFTIPPMLAVQLKKNPDYQLMVFCGWADGPSSTPILMEFPHVCEIKVNGKLLEANLRGMKNKPGTVSPANITRLCRLEPADYNKVEFIYANSTKRYYASTHMVKRISVESIVAEIERGKFLSKEKMLRMIEDRNKDEDIMATSSTLSLKCPLGFQRITVPCRSSYCQHLQCFDAFTFFNLNEQTPTWTYFKDILSTTPKSLENITVQADGSWELPSSSSSLSSSSTAKTEVAPSPKKKSAPPPGDVFVIDEDDSDNDTPAAPATPSKPTKPAIEIIDLISDSEDEDYNEEPAQTHVDEDGDTTMQDAAESLQNMAQSSSAGAATVPPSVKTEVFDTIAEHQQPTQPPLAASSSSLLSSLSHQHQQQQQLPPQLRVPRQLPLGVEIHSIPASASGSPTSAV
ncbi:SUMO ligase siz1, partial [Dissophora globulifera]